jgi:cytochrome c oxidase assembly protein subunit 15
VKNFRRFALLSTIATYLLIFVGGLVRVSGAGMGCPDWPKCFGRWIPPVNVTQLPPSIDPSLFNFTLAWIEYFNRLVGMCVGLLILTTAILAIKNYRKAPKILISSFAALLLVMYQAWQGGQIVASQLEPIIVSVHLVIALIIVSLLIYVTQQAYYIENPEADKKAIYPGKIGLWMGLLWAVGIIQVILGTQVRSAFEILSAKFPLVTGINYPVPLSPINYFHAVLGIIIAATTWYAGIMILKGSQLLSTLVKDGVVGIMFLILAQLAIGFIMVMAGLPSLMQLFHLWIGSLFIGILFLLNIAFRRGKGDIREERA